MPDTVQDPVEDVLSTAQAAKEAGVKHVLLQVYADVRGQSNEPETYWDEPLFEHCFFILAREG